MISKKFSVSAMNTLSIVLILLVFYESVGMERMNGECMTSKLEKKTKKVGCILLVKIRS